MTSLFKVAEFKKQLLRFLFREFEDQIYAPVIGKKLLYVSCDNECKKLFCVDDVLKTEFEPELYGSHEDGDTRVMFHAMHVDRNNPGSISVRGNDTDILIILLTSSHLLENSHLWFDTGFDSTNTRTWLDITSLSSALSYTQSLAGVYALTGCDYTPSFYRKGNVKGIELMEKQERMVKAFASLGNEELNEDTIKVLEEFVCRLYSSKFDNVRHVRSQICKNLQFQKKL